MKLLLLRRRVLGTLACLLAAVLILTAVRLPAVVAASAQAREIPVYCVRRDQKVIAVSFDAAWGNEDTQTLIDILDRYGVRATFFVVGQWVDKYPESVRALHEAGHEVMNHSDTHPHFNSLSAAAVTAEVEACNDKIEHVTGVRPTLIRCPFGEYGNENVRAIRALGMEAVQWDVDSLDWKELSAAEITRRVTEKVAPGSIVLFHNAALHTPEALPGILEALLRQGYTFVPVSELLLPGEYGTDYTIDHTGRQLPVS